MREFARRVYRSKLWDAARNAAIKKAHGMCERCMREGRYRPGEIVHHKVHLTPENVDDPRVCYGLDNLEYVCRDCHALEHPEVYGRRQGDGPRVAFDEYGNVVRR